MLRPSGAFVVGIPHESRIRLLRRWQGARLQTQSFLVLAAVEAQDLAVTHRFAGEREVIPADLVVFVGERRAVRPDLPSRETARVQATGDTIVPRRVGHAVAEGRAVAETILAG